MPGLPRDIFRIIGSRIRATRKERDIKMTIADEVRAAYKVKLNPSYLSKMERGKVAIPLKTLLALADFYQVHPSLWIDPIPDGAGKELAYLFQNPRLVELLATLRELAGEDEAVDMLATYVEQLNKSLGAPRKNRPVKAAREGRNWNEKS